MNLQLTACTAMVIGGVYRSRSFWHSYYFVWLNVIRFDGSNARVEPARERERPFPAVNGNALSGFAIVSHSDDDISLFVSCVDIPVSLGNLFQRIASISDRLKRPLLNQLKEESQIFLLFAY